jgi:uncharacterized protein (DUF58 family)
LDLIALFAVLFDFWRTPPPRELGVARRLPERVGLSVDFERVVQVRAGRAAGLELELREEFAASLEVVARTAAGRPDAPPVAQDPTGGPDLARLGAGSTLLTRRYRSSVRGAVELGALRLRLRGPLGLVQRQGQLHPSRGAAQRILVEPPLAGLARILRLAASERWQDLGVRRLRRRGGLTEFESLREYVQGDDLNLIDWKAFARRGSPIVREYQEERGQELIVLVDGGRRMGATSAGGAQAAWTKLDHALDTGLELCAVALQAGDRVGFAVFDRRLRVYVAPHKGSRQLGRLKEAVFAELPSLQESDLARALRELSVRHRRRALVLILSDVADPLSIEHQRRALSSGSLRHQLVLATLDDPALRELLEGGPQVPASERAVAYALAQERVEALARLRRSGARVLDTLPAEAAGPLLGAWLDARRGRLATR